MANKKISGKDNRLSEKKRQDSFDNFDPIDQILRSSLTKKFFLGRVLKVTGFGEERVSRSNF